MRVNQVLATILLAISGCASAMAEGHHYEFILPDHYIGWIQVIFQDPDAPPITNVGKSHLFTIPETGIYRTSSTRVIAAKPSDTFFYRVSTNDGSFRLKRVPSNYVVKGVNDGGFDIAGERGTGAGRGWYIFIGPPEIRSEVPFADWKTELESRIRKYGTDETGPPNPLPIPGRMSLDHIP